MDLVEAAGIDVSDWANFGGGPSKAASNPRYCYDWAFVQPGRAVVVNFWHQDMTVSGGSVSITLHLAGRDDLEGVRRTRAERLFDAIAHAEAERIPVRVIVNSGTVSDSDDDESSGKARVQYRLLDPVPWHAAAVDRASRECVLLRGPAPGTGVDQFSIEVTDAPNRREHVISDFVRDPAIRQLALDRAGGCCEYCGCIGFVMPNGRTFLETHHVDPLAEGGLDIAENVISICPNDHREAHLGSRASEMKREMREYLDRVFSKNRQRAGQQAVEADGRASS